MRKIALALIAGGLLLGGPAAMAQDGKHVVDVVELEGVIDPTSASYLADTIDLAVDDGSDLIIIELDTPGGLDVSMRDMVQRILRSPTPVAVWVGPPGARAASAGVFLVYASHVAAMAPGTNLGAAHPVDLGGDLSGATEDKAVNDAAKFLRGLAEARDRPVGFAEDTVRESASLSATEALDQGVVEVPAASIPVLLDRLDGRTVRTTGGERILSTIGDDVTVRFHQMGILRRILHAVTSPTVAFLLLTLGFWAIVFEISQPGLGIAGFTGAVALILAFYALAVLPVSLAGLLLVLLGLVLFTIDVFTAGLGVFTVGGALAFGVGGFLLFAGVSPAIRVAPWLIGLLIVGSILFFGFAMTAALRARRSQAVTGQEGLVGLVGEARAVLEPEGQVWVKGALWRGRAVDGPIARGSRVRVRRVDGLTLFVEKEDDDEGEGG